MWVEVGGPSIPDGIARLSPTGCGPLGALSFSALSQGCEVGLSCPARLLAAEMLTVSELQCHASMCCSMTVLQMFMDGQLAM